MAIHHQTIKRAAKLGITLVDLGPDASPNERYHGTHKLYQLYGEVAPLLLDDCACINQMIAEYPSFIWEVQDDSTVNITVERYGISVSGLRAKPAFLKAVSEWSNRRAELSIEDEQEDDEASAAEDVGIATREEEDKARRSGSVVSQRYRAIYAEAGHADNCGDWMANFLKERTVMSSGKTDVAAIDMLAEANGIDLSKYNRTNRGWEGRLRMTFGNILRAKTAKTGKLVDIVMGRHEDIEAPAAWMAEMKAKSDARKAKQGA